MGLPLGSWTRVHAGHPTAGPLVQLTCIHNQRWLSSIADPDLQVSAWKHSSEMPTDMDLAVLIPLAFGLFLLGSPSDQVVENSL